MSPLKIGFILLAVSAALASAGNFVFNFTLAKATTTIFFFFLLPLTALF